MGWEHGLTFGFFGKTDVIGDNKILQSLVVSY